MWNIVGEGCNVGNVEELGVIGALGDEIPFFLHLECLCVNRLPLIQKICLRK